MNSQNASQKFMTGDKIARLGWIVALIMFSISILLFIRLMSGGSSFRQIRADILEVCTAPGTRQDAECANELNKLYSILEEVQDQRENAAEEAEAAAEVPTEEAPVTPEAPAATTTPAL